MDKMRLLKAFDGFLMQSRVFTHSRSRSESSGSGILGYAMLRTRGRLMFFNIAYFPLDVHMNTK
jgi:hypothetical protein